MVKCPKCSSWSISGPRYIKKFGAEQLRFTCVQCGYHEGRPCDDAPDDNALMRAALQEAGR